MTVTALTPAGVPETSTTPTATKSPASATSTPTSTPAPTPPTTARNDGFLGTSGPVRRRSTDASGSDAFVTAPRTPATGTAAASTFDTTSATARVSGSGTVSGGTFEASATPVTARTSGAGATDSGAFDTSALSRVSGAGADGTTFVSADADLQTAVVAAALGAMTVASVDPLSMIDGLVQAFDIAQSTAMQLDADIASELASLGNMLTPSQRDAFLRSYRPDQERAASALADSSDSLANTLHALLDAAPNLVENPEAARKIFTAFERLAESPAHAAEVFAWTRTLQGEVGDAFSQAVGTGFATRLKEMVSTAVGNVAKMAFVEANGDAAVAAKKFCSTLDKLTEVRELSDLQDVPWLLAEADEVATDDSVDPIEYIRDHWSGLSEVGQSIAGTTLGFYLARAGTEALQGDLKSAVLELAKAGGPTISRVATEMLSYGTQDGLMQAAPGLGIATQLLALTLHHGEPDADTSGAGLSALGGAASAAYDAALQFGGGSIFGKALDVVGSALPAVGQLVSSLPDFGRWVSEGTKRITTIPGLETIGTLFGSAVSAGLRLNELRMSAGELQSIAAQARFASFGDELRQMMKGQREERERRAAELAQADVANRVRTALLEEVSRRKAAEVKKGE